jgi:hypothetical protein
MRRGHGDDSIYRANYSWVGAVSLGHKGASVSAGR